MQQFETPGAVQIEVHNPAGWVRLEAVEGATSSTVDLTALSRDAEEVIADTRVEASEVGGRHQVLVDVPGRQHGRHQVGVGVTLPAGADLVVQTASAGLTARGRVGSLDVKGASGDVDVDQVRGDARIELASGGIAIRSVSGGLRSVTASGDQRVGAIGGRAELESASGAVEVAKAEQGIRIRSASGDVRIESAQRDVSAQSHSGDIVLTSVREGIVELRNTSGDIEVGVVPGCRVDVEADSRSGRCSSEIPLDQGASGAREGPLVMIRARTLSGDVRIRRATETLAR